MRVRDFIALHGVQSVDFIATKDGSKVPHILRINTPSGVLDGIPSTKGWDQSKPTFVYPTEVDNVDSDGVITGKKMLYVFSNNSGIAKTLSATDFV